MPISNATRDVLRRGLPQAAVGTAHSPVWRAMRDALTAKRRRRGSASFKATVRLAANLLRLVWRVRRRGRPYNPARRAALGALRTSPPAPSR